MVRLASRALSWLPASPSRLADVLRSTIWLVPMACVATSIALAVALIVIDEHLRPSGGVLLFPGSAAGARTFLSAIVQAMISFTGVVFSITIVVLQLSSSQFSPRVLRNFLRDRTIQFSLGVFVATFVYAMTVLRAVQGGSGAGSGHANFVPRIAISGAFALVIASVILFVLYIGHVTNMIRVATIIASIGDETRSVISNIDAGQAEDNAAPGAAAGRIISSPKPGVIVSVNRLRLIALAAERGCMLRLAVRIGDFLPAGAPLFRVCNEPPGPAHGAEEERESQHWDAAVASHVSFDTERTTEQDVAFGFRQLVDIALQALSPAVNAPTTATQAIDEMHDLLRRLVTIPQPGDVYEDDEGTPRLVMPRFHARDYLTLAIEEIWHYGSDSPQIPGRLRAMLDDLADAALPEYRRAISEWRVRIGGD